MRLIVIRHATAVPRGTPGIPDEQRSLTAEGEEKFREAARGLARLYARPDALLTSPWLRAKQTAAIAGAAWKVEPVEASALAGGTFEEHAAAIDRFGADATVAVVGHEPYVSELVARLLGAKRAERLELKKGGVAVVDLPGRLGDGGTLVAYLPPKVLRRV